MLQHLGVQIVCRDKVQRSLAASGGVLSHSKLDRFEGDGPLPVRVIRDTGFYVQTAYMLVPRKLELYAGTSYVFSDFGRPKEFLGGANWYWADNRNYRVNLHLVRVDKSPVSSTFGFYIGGLRGTVLAIGGTVLF